MVEDYALKMTVVVYTTMSLVKELVDDRCVFNFSQRSKHLEQSLVRSE